MIINGCHCKSVNSCHCEERSNLSSYGKKTLSSISLIVEGFRLLVFKLYFINPTDCFVPRNDSKDKLFYTLVFKLYLINLTDCFVPRNDKPVRIQIFIKYSYKSSQSGFIEIIKSTFLSLEPAFNCFSRSMAS